MSKCRTAIKLPSQRQAPLEKPPRVLKSKRSIRPAPSKVFQRIKIRQPLSGDEAKAVSALKSLLQKNNKVVVISGAGISVNAGIPDFQTIRKSARTSFDISVYNSPVDTDRFHAMVRDISRRSERAEPTAFHHFLDELARNGRLLRHHTQNIDCIEHRLPNLWGKTVQLHGRIDKAMCQHCGWNGSLMPDLFCGSDPPDCNRCQNIELERERMGKRQRGIGKLRPDVVLYGEEISKSDMIGEVAEQDLETGTEVVVVVGTTLKVPGARRLVTELCRAAKTQGGFTVWINKDAPPSGLKLPLDLILQGDCDEVASLLSS